MSKNIALMDKIGEKFTEGDNFEQYALGFLERGSDVFQIDPYDIEFDANESKAYSLTEKKGRLQRSEGYKKFSLDEFDIIMDLSDIVCKEFSKKMENVDTLHINPPLAMYESADKRSYIHKYPQFIPDTLVSLDIEEIIDFLKKFEEIVVKDPTGSCGKDIERISIDKKDYKEIFERLTEKGKKEILVQRFIKNAYKGSKRVAVMGDISNPDSYRVFHVYGRKPQEGEWKDNLSQGGEVIDLNLTDLRGDEVELCLKVAVKSGLYTIGLDIIDDIDDEGGKKSMLLETNSVLALARGKYRDKLKEIPEYLLNEILEKN